MYLFTRQNYFFLFDNRAEVERLSIVCSVAQLLSCLVARLLIIFLTGALECHGRLGLPGWSGTNSLPNCLKVSKNDMSFCKFKYLRLDYCQGAQSAFKNVFLNANLFIINHIHSLSNPDNHHYHGEENVEKKHPNHCLLFLPIMGDMKHLEP